MNTENNQWYLRIDGNRYEIDYEIKHLTDGYRQFEEHKLRFQGRIITRRNLESAVKQIGRLVK